MGISEFDENEKCLELESIINNLRTQIDELRAENAKLQIQVAIYSRIPEDTDKGKVSFTDGEVMRDEPHVLEEYKAATARMNRYFTERCDDIDAQS